MSFPLKELSRKATAEGNDTAKGKTPYDNG